MSLERRRATRYQFIADAQVTEIASEMKFNAKTGDLSIGGCYLDMLNPCPQGAEIRVTISQESAKFTATGRVVFVFPNMGMGVEFTSVGTDQLAVLQDWLSRLGGGTGDCNVLLILPL
ncbi:MAG: PilZ domain-containing protein [Candidatus Acidiferrum sp.]